MIATARIKIVVVIMMALLILGIWSYFNWEPSQPEDPRARLVSEDTYTPPGLCG